MSVEQAYNEWSKQYDTNKNRTRDAEALVLRDMLRGQTFEHILEIGCGTGKNSIFLVEKTKKLTAVDLSPEMLAIAKSKVDDSKASFSVANILHDWTFAIEKADLVTFSLVLEHIEDLTAIFKKIATVTSSNAKVYIGELHPFKQYTGTKARYETEEGTQVVECYTHHISEFVDAANSAGFRLSKLRERFDENNKESIPRILGLLFEKQA
ncbi:class I SAM-dependent DNA methyltransferase [Jiulongibacter sp. NS-SX5]|uniref:class I SAM-dependent DNA methyltransferase n=1 Tax=Jiulongibacter sp. NS-SX5 TaxID=3463854 RepID=UPI00405844FC